MPIYIGGEMVTPFSVDAEGAAEDVLLVGAPAVPPRQSEMGRMLAIPKETSVMVAATPQTLKQYLHALADELPDTATTDEALYHLVLRREIEAGLADSEAGRTRPVETLMQRYGVRE